MTERGTTSRELVALEFDPESGDISVLRQRSGACRRLPCSRNDTRKDRKSLRGRWNRRAPTSTDYVFGGAGNPGGGFPHWGVGTPYISDRRKAALTSPRRLAQWMSVWPTVRPEPLRDPFHSSPQT